jgi:hypothetical protein
VTCTACGTITNCIECDNAGTACLACAPGFFSKVDKSCSATCDTGYYGVDGRCKKCPENVATCEINTTTKKFKVLTCAANHFIDPTETACVAKDGCGSGYFANATGTKCTLCDKSKCLECVTTSTFCTKCADLTKFADNAGACDTTAPTAQAKCQPGHLFDNNSKQCIPCHKSCDATAGCVGPSENDCKTCAAGKKSISTSTIDSVTVHKCGDKCLPFSSESAANPAICTHCPSHATTKAFDMLNKACVATTACPAGTVLMTVDKLIPFDSSLSKLVTGTGSDISVCAICDEKCATCHASDPSLCLTCASGFKSVAGSKTIAGTAVTYQTCVKDCPAGKTGNDCASN